MALVVVPPAPLRLMSRPLAAVPLVPWTVRPTTLLTVGWMVFWAVLPGTCWMQLGQEDVAHVGSAPAPLETRTWPEVPVPTFWNAPVEVVPPVSRPYAVVEEMPVPPYGTPTTEPCHVPPVMVPPLTVRPLTAVAESEPPLTVPPESVPPLMVAVLMVPVVLMVVMPESAPAAVRLRPLPLIARPVESMLTAPLPPPRLTVPVELPVLTLTL